MSRYTVNLNRAMDSSMKNDLELTGATVTFFDEYLPDLVFVKTREISRLHDLPFVTQINPIRKGMLLGRSKAMSDNVVVNPAPPLSKEILEQSGLFGLGSKVAVLDSGYNGRIEDSRNFSVAETGQDTIGHGSLVMALIRHMAPATRIFSAKVCTQDDDVDEQSVFQALAWVRSIDGLKIVNMSLGFEGYCPGICNLSRVVNKMAADGYTITCSAGNDGQAICTCPGCAEGAITVGSVDIRGNDVAKFSSSGHPASSKPDLLTSGQGVETVNGTSGPYSGTSFAAPIVAGIAACMYNVVTDPLQFREYLYQSCEPLSNVAARKQGYGKLSLIKLMEVIPHGKKADAVD